VNDRPPSAVRRDVRAAPRPDVRDLPHAYPLRLVDRILMVEPSAWAVVVKTLGRDAAGVDAEGRLPSVWLCEMMAQAAGLAMSPGPDRVAVLAAVGRFRCRARAVVAGETLLVIVRVVRRLGANVKVRALVRRTDRVHAAAELVLHFVTPSTPPA